MDFFPLRCDADFEDEWRRASRPQGQAIVVFDANLLICRLTRACIISAGFLRHFSSYWVKRRCLLVFAHQGLSRSYRTQKYVGADTQDSTLNPKLTAVTARHHLLRKAFQTLG